MSICKKLVRFTEDNEGSTLLVIILFTFTLRLAFTIISYLKTGSTDTQYLYWGEQFAQGNWVEPKEATSKMIIAPFISVIIALFIRLFSDPVLPFLFYNAVLTTLVVPVLYFTGKELFNNRVGWLILLWGVFFPEFFKYSPAILKESTLFFVIPFTILMLIKSIKEHAKVIFLIYASLSFAVLIHTDERYVFYLPVFATGFFLIKPFRLTRVFKLLTIWIGIIFILSIPWNIRNYLVFDQVVIISPRTTAFTNYLWGDKLTKLEFSDHETILNRNKEKFRNRTHEFEELYSLPPKVYGKGEVKIRAFINFWQPAYFKGTYITYGFRPQKWSLNHNLASILFYGIYLPFYFYGLYKLARVKNMIVLFIASIPVIHSMLHVVLVSPLERYRSPVTFIIVLVGIWALVKISFPSKIGDLNIEGRTNQTIQHDR